MGLQSKWIKEVITQAKLNNMTIIGETGTDLAALTGKVKGQVVIAYDTSAGFIQWFMYVWDGISQWIKVSLPTHTHVDTGSGGSYQNIRNANNNFYTYEELLPHTATWSITSSGTGATSNVNNNGGDIARRYETGTTTTGYSTGQKGGVVYHNWGSLVIFNWVWQLSNTNNLYFNLGLDMEDINAAQNNTGKMGIEWCDGQPAANYFMTSASGSARSSSDSTVAISTGVDGVRALLTPAAQINFLWENGTSINKGTNLPGGSIVGNNAIREGIKNNNGGATNRTLRILGLRFMELATIAQWKT